jgi:hypothetical protein
MMRVAFVAVLAVVQGMRIDADGDGYVTEGEFMTFCHEYNFIVAVPQVPYGCHPYGHSVQDAVAPAGCCGKWWEKNIPSYAFSDPPTVREFVMAIRAASNSAKWLETVGSVEDPRSFSSAICLAAGVAVVGGLLAWTKGRRAQTSAPEDQEDGLLEETQEISE